MIPSPWTIPDFLFNAAAEIERRLSWPSCPYLPGSPIRAELEQLLERMRDLRQRLDEMPLPSGTPFVAEEVDE